MSVNFYFAKRKNSRIFDAWNWPDKDWNGMGYGHFNLTRARIASLFNPHFGLVYAELFAERYMAPEDRAMLDKVRESLPDPVRDLILEVDCEGGLTSAQCSAFVREIEKKDLRAPIPPYSIELTYPWKNQPKETRDNAWMNEEEWVKSTEYLVGGIREAARRKCVFAWG